MIRTDAHQRQEATSWAAATLARFGCILHDAHYGAWDVEMRDGSWKPANDWRELCAIAREIQKIGA